MSALIALVSVTGLVNLAPGQEEIKRHLPEWLAPHFNRGLLASLDQDHNVVTISVGEILSDELLGKLKTLPKLRELDIGGAKQITVEGLQHLAELTSLRKLTLSSLRHEDKGLGDAALAHIAGLKSLAEFHLIECGTTDAGVKLLEKVPQLTHLEIRQEGRLTDASILVIANLKRLKHLSLNCYVGTMDGWMRFSRQALAALAPLHDLETLHLVGQDMPANAMQFPRLRSLSLGHEGVDDACAAKIAACRHLVSLELCYTSIGDDGLKKFADLPELQRLDLSSHVVTDAGIEHLKRLPALWHLSLRASRLTDAALEHVAGMKKLNRLDLNASGHPGPFTGKCFTIDGMRRLKDLPALRDLWLANLESGNGFVGLKDLTQLRSLGLFMTNISVDDLDKLEEALPQTNVSASGGGGFLRPPRIRKTK
jgi:hypothetical protein